MERFCLYKILPDGSELIIDSRSTLDQLRPEISNLDIGSDGARYFVHDLTLGVTIALQDSRRIETLLKQINKPPVSGTA
jgi:hypothetical protein